MYNKYQYNIRRFVFGLLGLIITGVLLVMAYSFITNKTISFEKLNYGPVVYVSNQDSLAFLDKDQNLNYINKSGDIINTKLKIQGTGMSLSTQGTYLSYKEGTDCHIVAINAAKIQRSFKCLQKAQWLNDSTFIYPEPTTGVVLNTDFFDSSSTKVMVYDIKSGKQSVASIKTDFTLFVSPSSLKYYFSYDEEKYEGKDLSCQFDTNSLIIDDCTKINHILSATNDKFGLFGQADSQFFVEDPTKTNPMLILNPEVITRVNKTAFITIDSSTYDNSSIYSIDPDNGTTKRTHKIKDPKPLNPTKLSHIGDKLYVITNDDIWVAEMKAK